MIERISCQPRPRVPSPLAGSLHLILRIDPTAYGRGTRRDLESRGYAVTSAPRLDPAAAASAHAVFYFLHASEPAPWQALRALPPNTRLVLCPVGEPPFDSELEAYCKAHGHAWLPSRMGPSLVHVLEVLEEGAP